MRSRWRIRSKPRCASWPQQFPPGLQYAIVYNATNFVTADITEIMRTLAITLVLVVGVVYLFLQDWRATLVPTIAIPVSLIGVFAILYLIGYSVNTVDLFAVVLAITLVVDDAIVVVENVTRHLEENPGQPVAQATLQAMQEVTGPIIATTLVLVAVFAPVGFIAGITGALYRQFAVTISVSVLISGVNALTLSPALCALILRPPRKARFFIFSWFNRGFDFARDTYVRIVGFLSRWLVLAAAGMVVAFAAAYLLFENTPISFLPEEDQGYFFVNVQTPSGASLERTEAAIHQVSALLRNTAGVAHTLELDGLQHHQRRAGPEFRIGHRHHAAMGPAQCERVGAGGDRRGAASVQRHAGGRDHQLQPAFRPRHQRGRRPQFRARRRKRDSRFRIFASTARGLIFAANQNPDLSSVFTGFSANVPQLMLHVDTTRAALLGVTPAAIYQTLEANLGGQFVNDFNYQNFVFQVLVQDDAQFRDMTSDIDKLYVRSSSGAMVPLTSLVTVSTIQGADAVNSYNLYPAVLINGAAAPGKSSGQAMAAMEQVAKAASAERLRLRVDGAFVSGAPGGRTGRVGLPVRRGLLVPVSGRAL